MPFTISHVAAAWPFEKSRLVLSAVILGAMAPDLEYFLPVDILGRWTHSLAGTFEFSLPATLILLAVFHGLLKRPAAALLPGRVQQRIVIRPFRFWPIGRLLLIAGSALAGIATHLAWDSFTHPEGWMVARIAWLQVPHVILGNRIWPNYKFAQYGSTLLGLLLLALWFQAWYLNSPVESQMELRLSLRARVAVIASILAIAFVIGLFRAWTIVGPDPLQIAFAAAVVVSFVVVSVIGLLAFSLALRVWKQSAARS
jgi:uncharacterized protein DUF4184